MQVWDVLSAQWRLSRRFNAKIIPCTRKRSVCIWGTWRAAVSSKVDDGTTVPPATKQLESASPRHSDYFTEQPVKAGGSPWGRKRAVASLWRLTYEKASDIAADGQIFAANSLCRHERCTNSKTNENEAVLCYQIYKFITKMILNSFILSLMIKDNSGFMPSKNRDTKCSRFIYPKVEYCTWTHPRSVSTREEIQSCTVV